MQSALRITTQVLPGNKIEIEIPQAEIGDNVDVFVILPEKTKITESKRGSIIEIIEKIHAQRAPKSVEEIDKYLQEERESWD